MPRPLPPDVVARTAGEHEAVRDHILDAALRVIAEHGLAAASTRAIAEEAGLGAGTLYNYFEDRLQLLARGILRRSHVVFEPLGDLPSRAGTGTVSGNLRYFAGRVSEVLDNLVPLFAAAFSEVELLEAIRREMHSHAAPDGFFVGTVVERYLLAERELGRVAPDADCRAAASLVVSLCHDRVFHRFLRGDTGDPPSMAMEMDLIAHAVTTSRRPDRSATHPRRSHDQG